jgi:hypothetical protein
MFLKERKKKIVKENEASFLLLFRNILFIEMKSSLKLDNYSTKDLANVVIQLWWWYYYYYYYLLQWGVFSTPRLHIFMKICFTNLKRLFNDKTEPTRGKYQYCCPMPLARLTAIVLLFVPMQL